MVGRGPRYDVVSASAYTTSAPSIAVDDARHPHVAWARPPTRALPFAPNVYYRHHAGTGWGPKTAAGVRFWRAPPLPQELDPSIDATNGFVHVLYKDDQNPGDGTPKTDRFRHANTYSSGNYVDFLGGPVTVMQPAAAQNDAGLPGQRRRAGQRRLGHRAPS